MGVDKGYGIGMPKKAPSNRAASAALRQKNIQNVAAKLSKAGNPLTRKQMVALGIAGGLTAGAGLLSIGSIGNIRGGGGTGLPSSNKTK
jgi:hypothetical protein